MMIRGETRNKSYLSIVYFSGREFPRECRIKNVHIFLRDLYILFEQERRDKPLKLRHVAQKMDSHNSQKYLF